MKDELAKKLVQGLKDAGINFVTYLPETRLSQIVPLIRDDSEMELVAVSSEQEAVTMLPDDLSRLAPGLVDVHLLLRRRATHRIALIRAPAVAR